MGEHAILALSASDKYLKCDAWAMMQRQCKNEDSYAAAEGTVAHLIFEYVIGTAFVRGFESEALPVGTMVRESGYDIPVTQEMWDCAHTAEAYVRQLVNVNLAGVWVEKRVTVIEGLVWGTADLIIWDKQNHILIILDLKYGRSPVEVEGNTQLSGYGIGALKMGDFTLIGGPIYEGARTYRGQIQWVHKIIYQPRINYMDAFRVETVHINTLLGEEQRFVAAAQAAMSPDPSYSAGAHCKYCNARTICPEAARTVKKVGELLEVGARAMTPAQLEWVQMNKALVERHMHDVKEQLTELAGMNKLSQFKLVEGRKNTVWADENTAKAAIFNALGIAGFTPRTPAQIEKMGAKGVKLVNDLSFKPKGAPSLAPMSSKKPEVNPLAMFDGDSV